jgi:hypothetical protein
MLWCGELKVGCLLGFFPLVVQCVESDRRSDESEDEMILSTM